MQDCEERRCRVVGVVARQQQQQRQQRQQQPPVIISTSRKKNKKNSCKIILSHCKVGSPPKKKTEGFLEFVFS